MRSHGTLAGLHGLQGLQMGQPNLKYLKTNVCAKIISNVTYNYS